MRTERNCGDYFAIGFAVGFAIGAMVAFAVVYIGVKWATSGG